MKELERAAGKDPEDEAARLRLALARARAGDDGLLAETRGVLDDAQAYLSAAGLHRPLDLSLNPAAETVEELFLIEGYGARACGLKTLREALFEMAQELIWEECLDTNRRAEPLGFKLSVDWEDAEALLPCWGVDGLDPEWRRASHGPRRFRSAEEAFDWHA